MFFPRWLRGIRTRLFLSISIVVVLSIILTAWLVIRGVRDAAEESSAEQNARLRQITAELSEYGLLHQGWSGIGSVVAELSRRTGERIRVQTLDGKLLADSDTLAGRQARPPVDGPRTAVDPAPDPGKVLSRINIPALPYDPSGNRAAESPTAHTANRFILNYISNIEYSICVVGAGGTVERARSGLLRYDVDRSENLACSARHIVMGKDLHPVETDIRNCFEDHEGNAPSRDCYRQALRTRLKAISPDPVLLSTGVGRSEPALNVSLGSGLAAAAGVTILSIVATALLSRRLLRPMNTLTSAAERLASGRRDERVPVQGGGELSTLAESFNTMVDSLQKSEQQQQRMISDIAHELRTPLTNVRAYVDAFRDGVLPADQETLESLSEEIMVQQRLVEDLHTLTLAEAEELTYSWTVVELDELLAATRNAHQVVTSGRETELALVVDEPVSVRGDRDRLRQALGNLLNNAHRATPERGSVTLRLSRQGDTAVIAVRDTGKGISPEDLPHIFDRFWRADHSRDRSTGGSGLGLALTQEIIRAHGGTIAAQSTLGVGTTVTVRLPASNDSAQR